MQKNHENHIIHFFFVKISSEILLKINYEVLIINCTYKTNRYKFSFLIINEQTAMHMSEWWFWNNQKKEKHFFEDVNSIY
jgi:hypothetical protein